MVFKHCFFAQKCYSRATASSRQVKKKVTLIKGKKVFITGGTGFIGSTLISRLYQDNEIVVYDTLSRNSLKEKAFSQHDNITIIEGDVLDTDHLNEAIQGSEMVVHCAGIAGIHTVTKSPIHTMNVNMVGSANVLETASKLDNCERVICFSTSEIFGPYAYNVSEQDNSIVGAVGEPRWTYAVSKLAEEHMAMAYYTERQTPCTVVRPFNVYGPGQVGEGALKIFIERALANQDISLYGDGSQIRAWCYVDDMVDALLLCLSKPEAIGQAFNIGNARAVETIRNLAHTIIRVLGSNSKIIQKEAAGADIHMRIPDTQKAKDLIGFEAAVDLEEGISRTAEFFKTRMAA